MDLPVVLGRWTKLIYVMEIVARLTYFLTDYEVPLILDAQE